MNVQTDIADKFPKSMEMNAGEYYWCSCGKSAKQPFCDGAHKGTEFTPKIVKLKEKQTVYWCMCKQTKTHHFVM